LARSSDFARPGRIFAAAIGKPSSRGFTNLTPEQPKENLGRELLREDYVTNLAEDEKGLLWIGYRQKGCEIYRSIAGSHRSHFASRTTGPVPYVRRLASLQYIRFFQFIRP